MDKQSLPRERLKEEGWTKRTVTDEPRLSELVDLYEEIGLEVKVVPALPADFDGCSVCLEAGEDKYKTIFTRPKRVRAGGKTQGKG